MSIIVTVVCQWPWQVHVIIKIFLFKIWFGVFFKANKRSLPLRVKLWFLAAVEMQWPNILASVNKRRAAASPQITVWNRTSDPRTHDSSYPNENVSQAGFSQNVVQWRYHFSHQASGQWSVWNALSFLVCLVCCLSDNDAADACTVRRAHIRLKRKWEGLMAADGTSIRASGDDISDGRLDRQGANIARVTYGVFWYPLQKGRELNRDFNGSFDVQ